MITTLTDICLSFFAKRGRIIAAGLLALALGACSMLRLGYNQGPELLYWWLDGYADFDESQSPKVRDALAEAFRWHRREQLPGIADQLAQLQRDVAQPTSAQAVCRWQDTARSRMDAVYTQVLPVAIDLAATLKPAQIRHLERQQAKKLAEFRDDHLQSDIDERREAQLKRTVERVETLYGRLDAAQRERVARALQASPYDAQAWFGERQARQQLVVQTIKRLAAGSLDAAGARAALAPLATAEALRPDYRDDQRRITQYNCQWLAELHNSTSATQRQAAQERLRGWERDLRALVGPGSVAGGAAAAAAVTATPPAR
jgi:hypothetical protein